MKNTKHTKNILISFIIVSLLFPTTSAYAEGLTVNATAYVNPHNNPTCTGTQTIEGITVAGKRDWIGKTVDIYTISSNGEKEYFGTRVFLDTGYGEDSQKYPGKGTIQTGETIDVYFEDLAIAKQWGKRKVYIEFKEEEIL